MKKIKRICTWLLCMVIMINCLPAANVLAQEDTSEPKYVTEVVGMNILGDSEYSSVDDDMKLSDFIRAMSDTVKYDISYLLEGMTVGEYVRCSEAVKVFVDILGYNYIKDNNIYPSGYLENGASIGLLKGLNLNGAQVMTYKDFCHMFYNALDIEVVIKTTSSASPEGVKYTISPEDTFRTKILGYEKIKGQIIANDVTSINGKSPNLNSVYIDDEQYIIPERLAQWSHKVGFFVTAYYRENDDDEKELVHIDYDPKSTNTELDADDIISYDNYTLKYETDKGTTKTLTLPKDVILIYNGVYTTEFANEMFTPENGSVTLISSTGGNKVDAVSIMSYEDCYISGINNIEFSVYNQLADLGSPKKKYVFNKSEREDKVFFYNESGVRIDFDALKVGDVLSIAQNGDYAQIYVCSKSVKNIEIKERYDGEDSYIKTKTDEEYKISKAFQNSDDYKSLSLRKSYDIYLNVFNRIVYAQARQLSGTQSGYYIKSYYDDNEDVAWVKLFLKEGIFKKYDLAKTVTVNDMYDEKHTFRNKPGEVYKLIKDYNGLMWFNLDSDNRIVKIDLALKKHSEKNPEKSYLIEPESKDSDIYTYKHEYRTWGYHYFMSSGITIYSVPDAENREDEELYKIVDLKSLEYDNAIGDAELIYSNDPDGVMISEIVRTTKQRDIDIREDLIVVTDVTTAVTDDDEVCKRIIGMVDGNKVVYDSPIDSDGLSAFDRATDLAHEGEENPPVYEVKKGDFIRVGYEYRSNLVFAAQLVYRSDIENPMFPKGRRGFLVGSDYIKNVLGEKVINPIGLDYLHKHTPMTKSINAGSYRVLLGYVYNRNGSIITLTTQDLSCSTPEMNNPEYFTESYNINSFGKYTTVDYDERKQIARQGNVDDVRTYKEFGDSCTRVLVTRYYGELNQIILINGEDK